MNENILLNSLKDGKREALGVLWNSCSGQVLNLAYRMMKDRDQAEDILMDIFVSIPMAVQSFHGNSSLSTWLYRLTVNACLMKLRAAKRHRELENENLDLIVEGSIGKQEAPSKVDPKLLEMGLSKLPAETRSMLWLKDAEGLDLKDLVDIYQMPEGTIKARLSRARQQLRIYLKELESHA